MSHPCALAAKRTNHIQGCIKHSIASWVRAIDCPPHLKYCVQLWMPQYKKDIKLLAGVQQRAMKMVNSLEGKMCKEQLRSLELFRPEKRRLKGDVVVAYSFLMRESRGAGAGLVCLVTSDMT